MKKNRPGVKITVLCQAGDIAKLERILFRETATLGIRRWSASRHKLDRCPHDVETQWGRIEGKLATLSDGGTSFSPEYESCRKVAAASNVPLKQIYDEARNAWRKADAR